MSLPDRRTAAIYLSISFVLGGIAGGSIGYATGKSRPPHPHGPPDREAAVEHFVGMLADKVHLHDDQKPKMREIAREGFDELRRADGDHFCRARDIIRRNHEKMAQLMTPEQVAALRAWDEEREEKWRAEHMGETNGPPPPPRPRS
jgi:hypothetical protein